MKVLISDYPELFHKDCVIQAAELGLRCPKWDILQYSFDGDTEELKMLLREADALITGFLPLNDELLSCMKPGSCISVTAKGYDNIDISSAIKHHISVMAIEEYCTEEVSEHTFALILGLARCLKMPGIENEEDFRILQGHKIGIFGYGKIGRRTAQIADAFGMKIAVYHPHINEKEDNRFYTDADTIFHECDVISNHMSANQENYHFFNEAAFAKIQKRPLFINCGRGETVDTPSLIHALDCGIVSGAGLDVLEGERMSSADKQNLAERANVILTPHIAFASKESLKKLHKIPVDNVIFFLNKEYERITSFVPGAYQC